MYNGELINASGSHSDDMRLIIVDSGPFEVTSQGISGVSYLGGTNQVVTWNVNGTNNPPLSTHKVTISLSTDGGYTYPITLLQSTDNDGFTTVMIPNLATDSARIRVFAHNNIYFDINAKNFEIELVTAASDQKLDDFAIKIYPNPVKDFFKIDLPSKLNYQAKLFDAKGVLLIDQSNNNYFDVANYSNGLYLLEIVDLNSNQKITKKLIISK